MKKMRFLLILVIMQATNLFDELKSINWLNLDWKEEIKNNITSVDELKQYVGLSEFEEESIRNITKNHPMNIPRYYLSLCDFDNPNNPIVQLSIPSDRELISSEHFEETSPNLYTDDKYNKGNGIIHKYPYTVLLITTEYCSMYCRHCFRKSLVGLPNDRTVNDFAEAIEYIREHKEITNVIISGGDPLFMSNKRLMMLLNDLKTIEHLNYVRLATRAPVVFPIRLLDNELIAYFEEFNKEKTLYIPTHYNHESEITETSRVALLKLRNVGVIINNQAVLLKGINDSVVDIINLMNGLVKIGVNPYYIYQCMPVSHVRNHFQVPLKEATTIINHAKLKLDGYAKRFKFIMSHRIGKIEIHDIENNKIFMTIVHPIINDKINNILIADINDTAGWFDDLRILPL